MCGDGVGLRGVSLIIVKSVSTSIAWLRIPLSLALATAGLAWFIGFKSPSSNSGALCPPTCTSAEIKKALNEFKFPDKRGSGVWVNGTSANNWMATDLRFAHASLRFLEADTVRITENSNCGHRLPGNDINLQSASVRLNGKTPYVHISVTKLSCGSDVVVKKYCTGSRTDCSAWGESRGIDTFDWQGP
jgi:hypothetical protein